MKKTTTLAHVALALVTYVPTSLALAIALLAQSAQDGIGGFVPAFLGFLTVIMVSFGWFLVVPSLVISIRGLAKRDHMAMNAVSLVFCALWMAFYWVVANFR